MSPLRGILFFNALSAGYTLPANDPPPHRGGVVLTVGASPRVVEWPRNQRAAERRYRLAVGASPRVGVCP